MIKSYKKLKRNEKLEKKIAFTCRFNNAKYGFIEGNIINLEGVNISYIEPHRYIIKVNGKKIVLLYFDEDNIFLYNRAMPIDIKKLGLILKEMKGMVL